MLLNFEADPEVFTTICTEWPCELKVFKIGNVFNIDIMSINISVFYVLSLNFNNWRPESSSDDVTLDFETR